MSRDWSEVVWAIDFSLLTSAAAEEEEDVASTLLQWVVAT